MRITQNAIGPYSDLGLNTRSDSTPAICRRISDLRQPSGRHRRIGTGSVHVELLTRCIDYAAPKIALGLNLLAFDSRKTDRNEGIPFSGLAYYAVGAACHRCMHRAASKHVAADCVRAACRNRTDRVARIEILDRARHPLGSEMVGDVALQEFTDILLEHVA